MLCVIIFNRYKKPIILSIFLLILMIVHITYLKENYLNSFYPLFFNLNYI